MGTTYYFRYWSKKPRFSVEIRDLQTCRFENLPYRFELPLILGEWIRLFHRYKFASEVKN